MVALTSTPKGRRALVLGGGIAGLTAACVLARHFEQVVLLEQDYYGPEPAVRPHTTHGAHVHLLLAGGLCTLSRLLPELPQWLDEMGLREGDLTYHTRVAYAGKWLPRSRSGIPVRICTRPDIEHLLKRSVALRDNVRVLDGCKVEGLLGTDRVSGVTATRAGATEEYSADLVVDAMGRGTPSARWLAERGAGKVEETIVDAEIIYTSAWFAPPADLNDDWAFLGTLPAFPRDRRIGVVIRFAADRMLCSMIEYGRPKAPRSAEEFVERFAGLCVPELHQLLRRSTAISPVSAYGNTQNRWRRYGGLRRFPDGLVILGDAACSLNPRYAQGMTVASRGAELLDQQLAARGAAYESLRGFSHLFQMRLDAVLEVPWQIALLEDRAWVGALSGAAPSLAQRLVLRGSQHVLKTAFSDLDTYVRFMRIAHLLDAPTKLFAPRTLARILFGGGHTPVVEDRPGIGSA